MNRLLHFTMRLSGALIGCGAVVLLVLWLWPGSFGDRVQTSRATLASNGQSLSLEGETFGRHGVLDAQFHRLSSPRTSSGD